MQLDQSVEQVRSFYNAYNDKFVKVYGNIIQAFRTNNVDDYLKYTLESIGLQKGERILDAGCGICGPAAYFASQIPDISIEACTVSDAQIERGDQYLKERGVDHKVNLNLYDYNKMDEHFEEESFDRIYFLESFGHSQNQNDLIKKCWKALKRGGTLYIKDLFRREFEDEWKQLRVDEIIESINRSYQYNVPQLNHLLSSMRKTGFLVEFIKTPEVNKDDFERLSISNEFQELFGVDKIKNWKNYIFPIDFYEVRASKPKRFDQEQHLFHLNK